MAKQKRLWAPVDFISLGIVIGVAAGIFSGLCFVGGQEGAGLVVALVLGVPASLMLQVGVIAKGVQVGNRK